jgi:hypothetical protein
VQRGIHNPTSRTLKKGNGGQPKPAISVYPQRED